MYFFTLFDQLTYFKYIVGKSTQFFMMSWCHKIIPFSEGILFSLLLSLTQYSSSKYIDRYRAILILMCLFLCKMSCFVCVFICSISSCSLSLFLLVVDTSPISMISLTSLSLSYVHTKKKQNLYVLSFSFSLLRCM